MGLLGLLISTIGIGVRIKDAGSVVTSNMEKRSVAENNGSQTYTVLGRETRSTATGKPAYYISTAAGHRILVDSTTGNVLSDLTAEKNKSVTENNRANRSAIGSKFYRTAEYDNLRSRYKSDIWVNDSIPGAYFRKNGSEFTMGDLCQRPGGEWYVNVPIEYKKKVIYSASGALLKDAE